MLESFSLVSSKTLTEPVTQNMPGSPDAPASADGFRGFALRAELLRGVAAAGFVEPRPIQKATIPAALAGRDVLGLAQTGTGKTAAFALPICERLMADRGRGGGRGPRALVIAPTRELAMQIHEEFRLLARFTRIKSTTIFGGVSQARQVDALRSRPDVVIACPGRLLDLHDQGLVDLGGVRMLVLDEADHMFDLGFLPNIRRILSHLPAKRQNLLFSATMPAEIRKLADGVLNEPEVVELGHSAPAATIEHALYPVASDRKVAMLRTLLSADDFRSAIVFSRTRHRAKRLATQLVTNGYRAVALQGNMSQAQRDRAMQGFRKGRYDVLVATDIAARGIDVAGVSHVINFDVPGTPDAYTHRIGRTGRSEESGKACTLVSADDWQLIRAIERQLGTTIDRRRLAGFECEPEPSAARTTARPAPRARQGHGTRSFSARKRSRRRGRA